MLVYYSAYSVMLNDNLKLTVLEPHLCVIFIHRVSHGRRNTANRHIHVHKIRKNMNIKHTQQSSSGQIPTVFMTSILQWRIHTFSLGARGAEGAEEEGEGVSLFSII